MQRRDFLKTTGLGLAALSLPELTLWASDQAPSGRKPNIIFVLSDDVGLSEIGCYGSDAYKTPRIDQLASTGTRFAYSYAMPLCGPSRCLALTGRYPFRTGLINNQSADAIQPSGETMIQNVLKRAGYATAQVGKWGQMSHGPVEWGFDESLFFPGSGCYWREQKKFYTKNGTRQNLAPSQYLPDLMHNFAVDFMTRHKKQPFFLYYSMSHVHGPIVRTPDSRPGATARELYADNVAYMDKLVGRLVDELDRLELREHTLIVFTGDNGTARFGQDRSTLGGRRIHGQKASMQEGGSRVPLIASWPKTTPAGVVNHDLTDFSDFFATFADVAGAALPAGVTIDSRSFAPQLKGQKGQPREWVYVELNGKSYVRDRRFKLTNTGELFDLQDAPFQEVSVAAATTDAEAVEARKRLQAVFKALPTAKAGAATKPKRPKRKKKTALPA
jgi:arylsulfatase A